MALWDIVGKATNQPIYNLLGGQVHDKLRAYAYMPTEGVKEDPAKADGLIVHDEIGLDKVAVPTHFYKVVESKDSAGRWDAIAFVMENHGYPRPFDFTVFERSVDWIEAHAGLDFMPDLDSAEEPRVEGTTSALWMP